MLKLRGMDSRTFSGSLKYASLLPTLDFWELASPAMIYANGKTASTLNKSRSVIFDSSTNNILINTDAIYAMISPDIGVWFQLSGKSSEWRWVTHTPSLLRPAQTVCG